jgi:hypothetical protein
MTPFRALAELHKDDRPCLLVTAFRLLVRKARVRETEQHSRSFSAPSASLR